MICLDTDFIIDFLKENRSAVEKLKKIGDEELCSTEVNYAELLTGVFLRKEISEKELQAAQGFFFSIRVLPLEHEGAYRAAQIAGGLSRQGSTINFNDCLIAGICLANNCSILTGNTKHFSRVKDMRVETY